MNPLGWMHRKFRQNNDEQSRNVMKRKPYSCFLAQWELNEQQYFPEAKNNSAHFTLSSESSRVEKLNEEETVEMGHEFFHGFLAIGTLGLTSITKAPMAPEDAMPFETTTEDELQSPNKKDIEYMGTKENKNMAVYPLKVYTEMPAIKEKIKEKNTIQDNFHKKNATSYKRSGKLDKGEKRETSAKNFMNKMLKKLDFTSRCSPTCASGNAIFCDSTEKKPAKPTKVFWKSRKIHPEAPGLHVNKSNNYELKNLCYDEGYDKEAKLEDEDNKYPHMGMLKKEIVANRPHESQPAGKNAHWIRTDAEYLVLEF